MWYPKALLLPGWKTSGNTAWLACNSVSVWVGKHKQLCWSAGLTLQHNLLRHTEKGHFHSDLQKLREYLDDFLNGEFLPVKYSSTVLGAGELCLQQVKWRFGEQHSWSYSGKSTQKKPKQQTQKTKTKTQPNKPHKNTGCREDAAVWKGTGQKGYREHSLHKARACLHLHCSAHFWSFSLERNTGEIKTILSYGSYFTGKFSFYNTWKNIFNFLKGTMNERRHDIQM